MATGTHTVADLLRNRNEADRRIADTGEEALVEPIQEAPAQHNELVSEMVVELSEPTFERLESYGVDTGGAMQRADEFTRAPTQKDAAKGQVAYPLDLFQHPVGFTYQWLLRATVRDVLLKDLAARKRHLTTIRNEIRRAIFAPTNFAFVDWLRGGTPLTVRRLLNADGQPIPTSDVGTVFEAGTHTHYTATSAVSGTGLATAVDALLDNVAEHDHVDDLRLTISQTDEATVRALPGFLPLQVEGVIAGNAQDRAQGVEARRYTNKIIGQYGSALVQTRTWVPAAYMFAYAAGDARKPLAFREDPVPALRGLRIAATNTIHPLRAEFYEASFGVGAKTRTNGAALYFNAGSGNVYAAPANL